MHNPYFLSTARDEVLWARFAARGGAAAAAAAAACFVALPPLEALCALLCALMAAVDALAAAAALGATLSYVSLPLFLAAGALCAAPCAHVAGARAASRAAARRAAAGGGEPSKDRALCGLDASLPGEAPAALRAGAGAVLTGALIAAAALLVLAEASSVAFAATYRVLMPAVALGALHALLPLPAVFRLTEALSGAARGALGARANAVAPTRAPGAGEARAGAPRGEGAAD